MNNTDHNSDWFFDQEPDNDPTGGSREPAPTVDTRAGEAEVRIESLEETNQRLKETILHLVARIQANQVPRSDRN